MDSQSLKKTFANWQTALKSPNAIPVGIKLSLLISIPLIAYFQDFRQVFSLALSDSEAQYVVIVPFIVAYFFYRRRKAFLISNKNSLLHDLTGISVCLLALLVYILGSYSFYALQLHLLSLPIFVAGLTLLLFGSDSFRLLIFPVALLIFISPFPLFFMDTWGGSLMSSDGALAALILSPFMPIEIVYQPIVIITTITTAGETIQFSLSAACSGIYSLTAFLFCAVVFGYIASGSIVKKVLYGVLAVAAAYFLNVFRITTTIALGRFFGLGVAVEFFHLVGGTVLAFIGTLILLSVGSKLLKLSFIQRKSPVCLCCESAKTICAKCGRIVNWPKIKINWKRMVVVLVFLFVSADLIVLASAVNYNVIVNSEESALEFDPNTGKLAAFSNETGYNAVFMGRESQAEEQLGLIYVGDYYLSKIGNSSETMYAIFEISDLQSKFHTWEGCLNYQAYPIDIEKIRHITIYDQNTNIVNGEIIIANAPTLNQAITLVYWFDSLNLKTNGTVTNYAVKITLMRYVPNVNNQTDTARVEATVNQLVSLSENLEVIWSKFKQQNNTFVVDLYKNSTAFTIVVAAMLFVSICSLLIRRSLMHARAKKKIASLSESDRSIIAQLKASPNNPSGCVDDNFAEKLETLRQQQILHEKITSQNNDIYISLVPY